MIKWKPIEWYYKKVYVIFKFESAEYQISDVILLHVLDIYDDLKKTDEDFIVYQLNILYYG